LIKDGKVPIGASTFVQDHLRPAAISTMLGSQKIPAVWRQHIEPTQTFYSWVMNNHWGTNYLAYQSGP
jgi:hypothetical protein